MHVNALCSCFLSAQLSRTAALKSSLMPLHFPLSEEQHKHILQIGGTTCAAPVPSKSGSDARSAVASAAAPRCEVLVGIMMCFSVVCQSWRSSSRSRAAFLFLSQRRSFRCKRPAATTGWNSVSATQSERNVVHVQNPSCSGRVARKDL